MNDGMQKDAMGTAIRVCRTRANMTIRYAARSLDVSEDYLSSVERGQREPSLSLLVRLGALYGVGLGEIGAEYDRMTRPAVSSTVEASLSMLATDDDDEPAPMRSAPRRVYPLTDEEVAQTFAAIDKHRHGSERTCLRAVLALTAYCGLRRDELLALQVEDITNEVVRVVGTRTPLGSFRWGTRRPMRKRG